MLKPSLPVISGGKSRNAAGTAIALPAPVTSNSEDNAKSRLRGLSPSLAHIFEDVQRELGYLVENAAQLQIAGNAEIEKLIRKIAEQHGFELTSYERDQILEYLERENKPFGLLQELIDDPSVSDIIVTNFAKVAVQQGRKNYLTDIAFPSPEAYEAFVERLLQKAGSAYSTKKPIADGMIGVARIHVVHRALCESGPYLTIRINRFSSVSIEDLVKAGLAPRPLFDYLRAIIRTGHTLLIVGEVGTGKTTLARALASSVPSHECILVIEDTPEIKLDHAHVRYLTTREANTDGAGRITPSECIRGGMRMAMNRIIFGEIRDAEAAEAFIDVCASGHPGLSTIHARSAEEAVDRLELFLGRAQRGANRDVLSEQVATAVQVTVHVNVCKITGKRRVMEVREIGPVADGVIRQREMFRYQTVQGMPSWKLLNKISAYRELIEQGEGGIQLSALPAVIELQMEQVYREAVSGR